MSGDFLDGRGEERFEVRGAGFEAGVRGEFTAGAPCRTGTGMGVVRHRGQFWTGANPDQAGTIFPFVCLTPSGVLVIVRRFRVNRELRFAW